MMEEHLLRSYYKEFLAEEVAKIKTMLGEENNKTVSSN
jgi:hypothetical protein